MDAPAIIMMVLFLLVIWGGLALSIRHFLTHPDDPTEEATPPVQGG
ncbi:MAG TPA: methionine/alanine import family NSS transporter small subunit [Candidatus Dietzia intestinipullorum]|nr:methionine/alanine import family NSS transporter small subunit [Candidatus Dietzia intestinipullorum]